MHNMHTITKNILNDCEYFTYTFYSFYKHYY